ncbi:coniferyl aldehyde dehydrogenase [Pseudohaliea rubra]|uniref:Aldehyde dehydrogenase n=1 Tax=Pseudohaliea rubra DSM 19751 TaxID=1265313 RepID=A0A095VRN2_9GAMM|nr:coniferyl aldehyde dehydrogenase [Pseudohaliea rubra]KGE04077.1 Aldehyde dehydrogenase, Probable coniferyl aldehyde dehydrogenase [Pseudohaliea rubra DSM 19751]
MNAPQTVNQAGDTETRMQEVLEAQREDFLREGAVSAESRIDRIDRAMDVVLKYQDRLCEALDSDFSCRAREVTLLTDVAASVQPLKHARKHLRQWMRGEKRPTNFPLNLLGGRSRIEYQPLGVVGVISPWNFPVNLTFGPLAGILAAGNRAMIKPSEFTPATSEVMAGMVAEAFDPKEVALFTGGPEVGQAFSALAFDHLLFTGATSVARHIMAAAARNLVPVTLELGGKSPVILSRSADLNVAVERIMLGKTLNAGQICLAPDYLLVPEEQLEAVITAAGDAVKRMYPTLLGNPEYTAVVNDRHYQRLSGYLEELAERGARVIPLNPADEDFQAQGGSRKLPPTLIPQPPEDSRIMEEEIFGPLLPIRTYTDFEETISYVNSQPRPLAAYYFGSDPTEEEAVLTRTTSGGVCINDVIMHVMQEELPFGGVGPAGMGAYHGEAGFRTFSHAKAIYRQSKLNVAKIGGMLPPYGPATEKTIKMQVKK